MSRSWDPWSLPTELDVVFPTTALAPSVLRPRQQSEVVQEKNNSRPINDFITVLALAQHLDVDFLPITWHPVVETLGAGATAEIRQALVDIQTSFAFKRIGLERKDAFSALASEILVLKSPKVSQHDNIITLAGICWDVDALGPTIWPVLVFDKAPYGNLEEFIQSDRGKLLSTSQLLSFMKDVGRALACLHQHSIIHCDVKPNNLLVFPHDTNEYSIKLADFGYATPASESGPIYLATPGAWTDPIYRGEGLDMAAAKQMEIYSFGMVCAWLIYQASGNEQSHRSTKPVSISEELRKLENVFSILTRLPGLDPAQLLSLRKFFSLTLIADRDQRTTDFQQLIHLLETANINTLDEEPIVNPEALSSSTRLFSKLDISAELTQKKFQISKNLFRLLKADFRLPGFIAKQLFEQAETATDELTKSNAQFQLAVCHAIGFGVRRDLERSRLWLSTSGKNDEDLKEEVELVRVENRWPYQSRTIQALETKGSLDLLDPRLMEYAKQLLNKLENHFREQLHDFYQVFDPAHSVVVLTRFLLGGVLDKAGQYEKAHVVYVELGEVMEQAENEWGGLHRSTLITWTQAAGMAFKLGKKTQAGMIFQKVYEAQIKTLGPMHTETLGTADALALVLKDQGKYREAVKLSRETLKGRSDVLGEGHPDTLASLGNLAMILASSGESREAKLHLEKCVSARKRIFGKGNGDTMICESNLSAMNRLMGDFAEAERIADEVLLEMDEVLGLNHPDSFYTQGNLLSTMHALGRHDKAREIGNRLLQQKNLIGADNPYHLTIMSNMSLMLQEEGLFEESLKVDHDILQRRKEFLGEDHPDTILTQGNIAATLHRQGKYNEAKEMYEKVLELNKDILGPNHPSTIDNLANLAYLLSQIGKYDSALVMTEEAVDRSTKVLGPGHHHTLMSNSNLGDLHFVLGNTDKAVAIFKQTMETRLDLFGESHHDTVQSMDNLAAALQKLGQSETAELYFRRALQNEAALSNHPLLMMNVRNNLGMHLAIQGRHKEARDLISSALAGRQQLLGADHLDTLHSLYNMGFVAFCEDHYGPAMDAFREVLDKRRRILGNDHADTLRVLKALAESLSRNGQYDEGEKLYRELWNFTQHKYGENHPDSLDASSSVALTLRKQGKLVEAEEILSHVVDTGRKEKRIEDHGFLDDLYHLAMVRDALDKHEEAEVDLRYVLKQREKSLGLEHDDTLKAVNLLGLVVRNRNRLDEAFELIERALKGRERMANNESQVYETLALQALIRQDQGNLEAAMILNKRALTGWESLLGPDHPTTLSVVENLASLTLQQEDRPQSLDLHRRVMEGREKVLGLRHPDTIRAIRGLGAIKFCVGAEEEAVALYDQAHSLICQLYGPHDPRSKEIEDEIHFFHELIEEERNENETSMDVIGR